MILGSLCSIIRSILHRGRRVRGWISKKVGKSASLQIDTFVVAAVLAQCASPYCHILIAREPRPSIQVQHATSQHYSDEVNAAVCCCIPRLHELTGEFASVEKHREKGS